MKFSEPEIVKTYTLKYPVEYGSEVITQFNFTRIKAKHLQKWESAQGSEVAKSCVLIGQVCNQPIAVVNELDMEDLSEVSMIIASLQEKKA